MKKLIRYVALVALCLGFHGNTRGAELMGFARGLDALNEATFDVRAAELHEELREESMVFFQDQNNQPKFDSMRQKIDTFILNNNQLFESRIKQENKVVLKLQAFSLVAAYLKDVFLLYYTIGNIVLKELKESSREKMFDIMEVLEGTVNDILPFLAFYDKPFALTIRKNLEKFKEDNKNSIEAWQLSKNSETNIESYLEKLASPCLVIAQKLQKAMTRPKNDLYIEKLKSTYDFIMPVLWQANPEKAFEIGTAWQQYTAA